MGQVIWTNHLRDRIKERGLDPNWVDTAVRFPDEVQRSSTTDSNKHIKVINGYQIVAAVKRHGSDWIITSAWWKPAYGHQETRKPQRSFLEKMVYKLVVKLEKLLTGRK
jgi:hypothetical protein